VVRVDRFESGPVTVTGLLPSVVDMDEVGPSARIQGVIGQDVLAPLRYTIDFKQRRLVWWPKQNAEPFVRATTFALESSGGRFLVSLPQRGFVLRLVPDSGAATLLLFARDELRSLSYLAGPAELSTLSARRSVRQARVHELQVGRRTLRDIPAVVVGRNIDERRDSPRTDGLLPLHLFERVTFDGPRGRIVLQPGT
jgi:hypothetical protein